MCTYMAVKDPDPMVIIKEATTKYSIEAKKFRDPEKRLAKISVPHIHVWNALIRWALQNKNLQPADKEHLNKCIETIKASGPGLKGFEKHVRVCRLEKAYEKTKTKFVIAVLDASPSAAALEIVERVLILAKLRTLPGQAPPGHFEELLQNWLEEVQAEQ